MNNIQNKKQFKLFVFRLLQLFVLFILTYGFFYFSYKYYVIDFGGDDFRAYYPMYEKPMDYSVSIAPYIYRQFHAVMAYGIYEFGTFYELENAFQYWNGEEYNVRIFYAAILSNYIALLLTCLIVTITIEHKFKSSNFIVNIFGGLLCFFPFLLQQSILTGLSEGWSWFLVALTYYFYTKKKIVGVIVLIFVSIFQRELISLVFATLAFIDTFISAEKRSFLLKTFVSGCIAFFLYLLIRKVFIPVEGFEGQLNPQGIVESIKNLQLTKAFIFQNLLSQNLFFLYFIAVVAAIRKTIISIKQTYIIQIGAALIMLFTLGILAGIGNNIGRVSSLMTPIICVNLLGIALYLFPIKEEVMV